jgi:hypothetical protein
MAGFNLTIDLDGQSKLSDMQALLSPGLFTRALKGGTQYAAKAAPPAIAKAVGARYGLKARDIKDDISGPRFTDGGTTAILTLSRRPRTAAAFGGRQTTRGYSFAVVRGERQLFRRGFVARGAQGIELPFYRVRPGRERRIDGGRSPIDVIHGVSLGSVFVGDSRFGKLMQDEVEQRMSEQFMMGIDRELKRAARGF